MNSVLQQTSLPTHLPIFLNAIGTSLCLEDSVLKVLLALFSNSTLQSCLTDPTQLPKQKRAAPKFRTSKTPELSHHYFIAVTDNAAIDCYFSTGPSYFINSKSRRCQPVFPKGPTITHGRILATQAIPPQFGYSNNNSNIIFHGSLPLIDLYTHNLHGRRKFTQLISNGLTCVKLNYCLENPACKLLRTLNLQICSKFKKWKHLLSLHKIFNF